LLDRIPETVRLADQFLFRLVVGKRSFADRTHEQVEQFRVHVAAPVVAVASNSTALYFLILPKISSPSCGSISAPTSSTQHLSSQNRSHFTASFSVMMIVASASNSRSAALKSWWSGNGCAENETPSSRR